MSEKRFLVDVGISNLPFPVKVISRDDPEGQSTIINISINARIKQGFEARWIDKFIQIVHRHKGKIGTETLRVNILDYMHDLQASMVQIDFDYPFFVEKVTPVSKEKCLVCYNCTYSAKAQPIGGDPVISFQIKVPAVTTYPASTQEPNGLFGQLSILNIEIESHKDVFPEDVVEMVDEYALAPVYSFLTEEDQRFLIHKIHAEQKSSVIVVDEIKERLARNRDVDGYKISCANYGMLHSYDTIIRTEKSMWVPFSGYNEEV